MSIILITGCNGNLSLSLIKYFSSKKKYEIIGCDLHSQFDPKNLLNGLDITYVKTDLQNLKSIENLSIFLNNNNCLPNIIINNAAIDSVPIANVENNGLDLSQFDEFFRVNVRGPIYLFELISREWIAKSINGNIVNISSIYSKVSPDPNLYSENFTKNILYGASKSALNNAFKQISVLYASKNIKINTLILAGIESISQSEEFKRKYKKRIPIGRFLNINEIFNAFDKLFWICSNPNATT